MKDKAFQINAFLAYANRQKVRTVRQILALFSVYNQPGITTIEIGRILGLDRQAVKFSTVHLKRIGLIDWEPKKSKSPGKPESMHFLTEEGMELMDRFTSIGQ